MTWLRHNAFQLCVLAFIAICIFLAAATFIHGTWKMILGCVAYLVLVTPWLWIRNR